MNQSHTKRKMLAVFIAAACAVGFGSTAWAQQGKLTKDGLKIGVLSDMSGVYADYAPRR